MFVYFEHWLFHELNRSDQFFIDLQQTNFKFDTFQFFQHFDLTFLDKFTDIDETDQLVMQSWKTLFYPDGYQTSKERVLASRQNNLLNKAARIEKRKISAMSAIAAQPNAYLYHPYFLNNYPTVYPPPVNQPLPESTPDTQAIEPILYQPASPQYFPKVHRF